MWRTKMNNFTYKCEWADLQGIDCYDPDESEECDCDSECDLYCRCDCHKGERNA